MIKKIINKSLNSIGYNISKSATLENRISQNYYKWLQDFGVKTIVDVGANNGIFALMINKILPDAFIYSFEPIQACYLELQKNISHIKNIKAFNFAIGEKEEDKEFHINDFTASSSFLKVKKKHVDSFPHTANTTAQQVKVKTLDSFYDIMELNGKVLLKLDVQGYELSVLKGAIDFLKKVDMIITEVSYVELYEQQPLFHDIYDYLYSNGFIFHGNFDQMSDPGTNYILQADAIFIKH